MATSSSRNTIRHLIHHRTLELEADRTPENNGCVVMEEKLLVIDCGLGEGYLHVYNLHDCKLITSHRLKDRPGGVCLINQTEVAVCLGSEVVILSVTSRDGVKLVNTLRPGLWCQSLVKWRSDKLVISGNDGGVLCWGVLSITDGRLDSTHDICTGTWWTRIAVREDTVYISCLTSDSITTGVHAFNLLTNKQKFLYRHRELTYPWSIMADRDYVYVCNRNSNRIHQLTDSGQLVTIHTVSSQLRSMFYDDQQGLLYTPSSQSNVITVYKMETSHQVQQGIPVEILNMDDRSIQLFEDALKDGKETVYSIRIMVVGHVGVGKTTLVKRLLGDVVNISERRSTEGIDVYVNCCDVSSSTCEWTRRDKDSEQDYEIQRLVKVLNENYQMSGSVADQEQDAISPQQKTMDQNLIGIVAEYDKNKEVLDQRSQQNISHNLSSTASHPKESPSTDVQRNHTIPENNTIPGREPGENIAIESHKRDPLREMLQVVKENPDKLKQDVRKYARLTILDFAGQYSFYTTHQMFLTRRAIYLMVLNVSEQITDDVEDDCYLDTAGKIKCKVQELLEIWMNSIHSCARSDKEGVNPANSPDSSLSSVIPPPVILVGTHIDQIRKRQSVIRAEKYKLPPKMQAGMVTLTTTSTPDHSGEQLTLSSVQESSHTSTERLQRKRRATEPVSSIQKSTLTSFKNIIIQMTTDNINV
ncbi:hypothetical protein ACJMK2_001888 [Sinanodonta woodiana]|uniref:Uncharacterized protein n=1 Tax=Sinanodonta woodiana TaxID=1069815 RepID=A0ABD3XTQ3_SINWO